MMGQREDPTQRPVTPAVPRIERMSDGACWIWVGEHRMNRLVDDDNSTIYRIWRHMMDKSENDAAVYLTGIVHGLREAVVRDLSEALAEINRRREAGQEAWGAGH
jgi:hypothetical protein